MKTATVLVIAILSQAVGDVYVTRGMKAVVEISSQTAPTGGLWAKLLSYVAVGLHAARSPEVLVGTLCLIVFFALYSAALSWADLSFVLPATAFGYVLNVAAGHYLLNERVSSVRWAGAVVITFGVVFVSRSGVRGARNAIEAMGISASPDGATIVATNPGGSNAPKEVPTAEVLD